MLRQMLFMNCKMSTDNNFLAACVADIRSKRTDVCHKVVYSELLLSAIVSRQTAQKAQGTWLAALCQLFVSCAAESLFVEAREHNSDVLLRVESFNSV
ncbi:hypothetical protein AVEN_192051-1 [Araneus ventricosus]|uniref:Uncharacterized protein n=1 Tax=Araneus ventricosus TaxID=182803 RepID=A0A4Y2B972_ARAVE|nr:hypothetical protein AVEN_192051-1 [Araneus ventricosus]